VSLLARTKRVLLSLISRSKLEDTMTTITNTAKSFTWMGVEE
jgi:hypothetical protein